MDFGLNNFADTQIEELYLGPSPGHQPYSPLFPLDKFQLPSQRVENAGEAFGIPKSCSWSQITGTHPTHITSPITAGGNRVSTGPTNNPPVSQILAQESQSTELVLHDSHHQKSNVRLIHLDYVIFCQSTSFDYVLESNRRHSASTKEWERFSPPANDQPTMMKYLLSYTWGSFQEAVVQSIRQRINNFDKLVVAELDRIKWQLIIAGSQVYGLSKMFFATSEQDFFEFVEAVQENINTKVTVKLVMEDPTAKAKQLEQTRNLEQSLTLNFGSEEDRRPLERERARDLF